jgi:outer membrane protein OmpA-like peptidoglycan-associated protein
MGGVTWNGGDLQLSAMGGAGIVRGYANPDWRALLQLRYLAPERVQVARAEPVVLLDTDKDGIPDLADCAPLLAEDYNGVEDLDGAPDAAGTVDVVVAVQPENVGVVPGHSAKPGEHTVQVKQVAEAAAFVGESLADSEKVRGGTLTLKAGGREWTVNYPDGATLQEVAEAVRKSGAPVVATVEKDGAGKRLSLVSAETGFDEKAGPDSALVVTESITGTSGKPLGVGKVRAARNAEALVDGRPVRSRSNRIEDAVTGVTLVATRPGAEESFALLPANEGSAAQLASSPSRFDAEVGRDAVAGKHAVQVMKLAQGPVFDGQDFETESSPVKAGTLVMTEGSRTWTVKYEDGMPLSEVAKAVAASGAPADAEVVKDSSGKVHLQVRARNAGTGFALEETSTGAAGQAVAAKQTCAGTDSQWRVDGSSFTGRGNVLDDAVAGVVLTARSAGEAETLEVTQVAPPARAKVGKQPAAFAVVAEAGAHPGSYEAQVKQVAQPASWRSGKLGQAGAGTLVLKADGREWKVAVAEGATAAQVAEAVAKSGAPVDVTVEADGDGQRVVVTAKQTGFDTEAGDASALSVSEVPAAGGARVAGFQQAQAARNAVALLDGRMVQSRTNRLEDEVTGVVLLASAPSDRAEFFEVLPANDGAAATAGAGLTASRASGFTADVGEGAVVGKYSVQVTKLASAALFESAPAASEAAPVKGGMLRIASGGETWEVGYPDGASLSDVAKVVAASGAPVTAELAPGEDGTVRLRLSGKTAGREVAVSENATGSTGMVLALTQVKAASASEWLVNGNPFTGTGNRLAGAVAGVSLTAASVGGAETLELAPRNAGPALAASESSAYVAEVGAEAQEGQYPVQVMKLGGPAVYRSAVYPTDTSPVAGGELSIGVGAGKWRIAVPDGEPLAKVAAAVNASGAPVKARVVKAGKGYQLVIVTRTSGYDVKAGAASALVVKQTVNGRSGGPLSPTLVQAASNTEWVVDGKPYISRTRRLHGAIVGVTLVAKQAGAVQPLVLAPKAKDGDKDGVADAQDACPGQSETVNGYMDGDGCPDVAPRIQFANGKFDLREQVRFETAKAVILDESNALLDEVARLLNEHPEVKVIRVEGHTDSRGARAYNINLSANRAKAVVDALVKRSVERKRLQSQGFGPDKPLDTNDTDEGMARNRRTEFYAVQ